MAQEVTKAQLKSELKALRAARTADGWVTVGQALVRWGGIVLVARYGFMSIQALAGRTTLTDIGIDFLGNIQVSVALSWTVAIFGGVYGLRQRTLRRNTVERLQNRIKSLEKQVDRNRTSSGLTARGDSRPEDKV